MGLFMRMDIDDLKSQFPNADISLIKGMALPTDETTEDRPEMGRTRKRIGQELFSYST